MDLKRFHAIFVEESSEHLEVIENGLLQLERNPDDEELLNSVFRSAHTIKGSSGTVGLPDIARFTHVMEEILEQMRAGQLRAEKGIINTLLEALDLIKEMIAAVATEEQFPFERCTPLLEQMQQIKGGEAEPVTVTPVAAATAESGSGYENSFHIIFIPSPTMFQCGQDPARLFDELREIGRIDEISCDLNRLPSLSELDCEALYLSWQIRFSTDQPLERVQEVFIFVADDCRLEINRLSSAGDQTPLLGKLLLDEGVVSQHDLQQALSQQKKLGEILVEQGKVESAELKKVLDKQLQSKTESVRKMVSTSIRIDLHKLDHLVNLVGEMVITHSMFHQVMYGQNGERQELSSERIDTIFSQLQRIGKDIQESAMALRMMPVGEVFQRFIRLVREISASKGKEIELVISGEETELDKGVLEKIADPLVHLIRNSIDHGIEPPEERAAIGKQPKATIHLKAYQLGDAVYIDVQDDGRGLNRERILAKGVEKGLVQPGAQLSDDEIYSLILMPGFSTAEKITDISGRGVGMDVVKKNIEGLNGKVQLKSRPSQGTTVSIRLPLTLAIIDGLTVGIGGETFIIPITSVIESLRPTANDVNSVTGQGVVVNVRGERIPLIPLYSLLGIPSQKQNPCEAIVVVTQYDSRKYGLLVDELLGEQQIVLKNLGSATPKVPDIAGGTILGDGKVALVLDLAGIIATARG